MTEIRVSYLTMNGPKLWGSVGSLVTEPGEGRWVILRHLDPARGGPDGYFVVDLVEAATVSNVLPNEIAARAWIQKLAEEAT